MSTPLPTQTPNVVVENPSVRRVVTNVLGVVGIVLPTVILVDLASPAFDITAWTEPAFVAYAYVAGLFGLVVTRPNIPTLK